MDLRDEQPTQHEIGNRTYIVADVEPLDVDGVRTVEVGTALWLLGFLALLPFYGAPRRTTGRTWWLWTCLAGFGLGLFGLEYFRRRRRARRSGRRADPTRARREPPADPVGAGAARATAGYGEKFARLVADGEDVDGEARLADALVARGARILDVGSGMGRVAGRAAARGHDVVGGRARRRPCVAQSLATYPDLAGPATPTSLGPTRRSSGGVRPRRRSSATSWSSSARDTERAVLHPVRERCSRPGGRVLVGFHPVDGPTTAPRPTRPTSSSPTPPRPGCASTTAFGILRAAPAADDYAVWLLARDDAPQAATSYGHAMGPG